MTTPPSKPEPYIVANQNGWEPSRELVDAGLALLRTKGMRTDWKYCLGLDGHGLMFAEHSDHDIVDSCVVVKGDRIYAEDEWINR